MRKTLAGSFGPSAARAVVIAAGIGMLVSACGSGGTKKSDASTGGAGTGTAKKHVTVAFYEGSPSEQAFVIGGWGALAAGQDDGNAKIVNNGPATATPSSSVAFALNLAESTQPDGYAMDVSFPSDDTLFPKLINIAHGNVLVWQNSATSTASQTVPKGGTTFVGLNFGQLGSEAAEIPIKDAHMSPSTTGTALVGNCYPGAPNLEQMQAAGVAGIQKLLPHVKVVTFGTSLAQSANTADWVSEISKTQNLVFALPICGPDTQSLLVAKDRGIGGNFVASSNSPATPQQFAAIADGKMGAGVVQDNWSAGYIATALLIDAARGKPFPAGWINTAPIPVDKTNASRIGAGSASEAAAAKEFKPIAKQVLDTLSANTHPMPDLFKNPTP